MDDKEVGRRVRAARWYKGLRSVSALAQAIDQPGLAQTTLYAIEQGNRHAPKRELDAIAEACGLPTAFFTMDFWDVAGQQRAAGEISQLRSDVKELQEHLRRLRAEILVVEAEEHPRTGEDGQTRTGQSR